MCPGCKKGRMVFKEEIEAGDVYQCVECDHTEVL